MEIGDYIKSLRLSKGLTLEQVGNAVGVGKSTVRKWETGYIKNMGRDKIASLAHVLGTTPDSIINCGESADVPMEREEPEPEVSPEEQTLLEEFRKLSLDKQKLLLSLAEKLK